MNKIQKRHLERVASWLESGAPHVGEIAAFDMNDTISLMSSSQAGDLPWNKGVNKNSCGTACCIAGAIVQFDLEDRQGKMAADWNDACKRIEDSILTTAKKLAGLNDKIANSLFCPCDQDFNDCGKTPIEYSDISPAIAAKTIRNFLATGKVIWNRNV